jgi:hypothetical protein
MPQSAPKAPPAPKAEQGTVDPQKTTITKTADGKVVITTNDGADPAIAPEAVINVPPPQFPYNPNEVPEGAVIISVVFFIATALTVVLLPVARAFARRMDRSHALPDKAGTDPEMAQRLARMEQAVDSIAIEVERISEGQRFTTKLLSERSDAVPAQPRIGQG